jgi:hypothetical protein
MEVILGTSRATGSIPTVGTAHVNSAMFVQNGSQRFLLIVKEASDGPMKETTYEVELIYEKYEALKIVSLSLRLDYVLLTAARIRSLELKSV